MGNIEENDKGKITTEKVLIKLNKNGLDLTKEQVNEVLKFMRKAAAIVVDRYLIDAKKENVSKHK